MDYLTDKPGLPFQTTVPGSGNRAFLAQNLPTLPRNDAMMGKLHNLGIGLLGLTLVLSYFLNLGLQPFYVEEPRRILVAMEMLASGNWWIPKLIGDFYYNKPPLYNWLLLLFATLGGGFHEWAMRLPTVMSTLAIAFLVWQFGRRHIDAPTGPIAAGLFLCTAGVCFVASTLAEIDLFYSLLSFIGIVIIYPLEKRGWHWAMFLGVYACGALGFLTKGFPSLAFIALSLLAHCLDRGKWRLLFSPAHFAGIALLALIVGGYYWQYAQYHDLRLALGVLADESGRRTAVGNGLLDLGLHVLRFPWVWLGDMLPSSLLVVFLLRRDLGKLLWQENPFVRFCILMLLVNALPYWLSPGTRIRYVYMLYPFAAVVLAYGYAQRSTAPLLAQQVWRWIWRGLALLLPPAALAIIGIPDLDFLPYRHYWAVGLAFSLAAWALWIWRSKNPSVAILVALVVALRLSFDCLVLPDRAKHSGAQLNRELAMQIQDLVGKGQLFTYGEEKVLSYTTSLYLNLLRGDILRRSETLESGKFYLLPERLAPAESRNLLAIPYNGEDKALIEIP